MSVYQYREGLTRLQKKRRVKNDIKDVIQNNRTMNDKLKDIRKSISRLLYPNRKPKKKKAASSFFGKISKGFNSTVGTIKRGTNSTIGTIKNGTKTVNSAIKKPILKIKTKLGSIR